MKEERSFHQTSQSHSVFSWGASTHVGNVRTQNQDYFGISDQIITVADGMGGHNGGEIASETAIKELLQKQKILQSKELAEQVTNANEAVHNRAQENPTLYGMGTTLCAIAQLTDLPTVPKLGIINVGDSRIYVLAGGQLRQISQDHSLVETMHREGKITKIQAQNHPQRNVITRSIGTHKDVEVDCWELTARVGDRYLLCTDGLTNEVLDSTIHNILHTITDPQKASEALIQNAIEAEGLDNVTAVVVDIKEGNDQSTPLEIPTNPTTYTNSSFLSTPQKKKEPTLSFKQATLGLEKVVTSPSRIAKLFLTATFIVIAVGSLIGHYAREGFFITFESQDDAKVAESQVVIYKGTQGGVLWFEPTVEKRTALLGLDLNEKEINEIDAGIPFDTLNQAQTYIDEIINKGKATKATG
ncbi:MAG: Stp1/IreP family PP2C-type Ser/Thr phosphatase [Acidimicrobiales bacterium]|jgi:protein phosphatase|nr:Stp1/IreP family PP2C-type Ser/Thr phosphatase [Acidimicrobiales bacterium]MDP6298633.1 Stp1/IreP family PP2C-type Ser/Thr phosphatase [Acidimicrobiales bacterium]HJM27723.1 Stp1/IreP family PP2C-type Ser/Thr phosphatase [Acidimicrobiales bacterium]HJM98455.1 Stp1/IreP family PP2C-type Ser/Thr phosphatase [Acidimicrobiales bacterium]